MINVKIIPRFIVSSNLWVSLSVSSLAYQTGMVLNNNQYEMVVFVFFCTLFTYNFQRIYKFKQKNIQSSSNIWMKDNEKLMYSITLASLIVFIVFLSILNLASFFLLAAMSLICFFYVVKIFPSGNGLIPLREIPFIKIFLIAVVWIIVTVFLPYLNIEARDISFSRIIIIALEKFCFVFALSIPFDIRDLKYDSAKIKTIPQVFGVNNSIYIAVFSIGMAMCFAIASHIFGEYSLNFIISIGISYILSVILVLYTKKTRKEWYYGGILDGLFLFQTALIILLSK